MTTIYAGLDTVHSAPDLLVLQDVNAKGAHRWPRIKELNRKVIALAKRRKLKVAKVSGGELREVLFGNQDGTRHEMAMLLAGRFPDELASRVPPKRKAWTSEYARMDIFEAVALALTFLLTCRSMPGVKQCRYTEIGSVK